MNGQREIDEAHRDWLDHRRNPRGNRLTIQPINAPGIGRDEPTDEVCPHCGGSGMTDGWVPSYCDPCNISMAPEAEPCICKIKPTEETK